MTFFPPIEKLVGCKFSKDVTNADYILHFEYNHEKDIEQPLEYVDAFFGGGDWDCTMVKYKSYVTVLHRGEVVAADTDFSKGWRGGPFGHECRRPVWPKIKKSNGRLMVKLLKEAMDRN